MTTMTQIGHFTCDVCDHIASFFIKVGQYLAVAGQHRANSELKRLGYLKRGFMYSILNKLKNKFNI